MNKFFIKFIYTISSFATIFCLLPSCARLAKTPVEAQPAANVELWVLGIAQDGGYPHAGCGRACCQAVFSGQQKPRSPVSLAVTERSSGRVYMFEASPDFPAQWRKTQEMSGFKEKKAPDGIFLTHAHIGHYLGLAQLGREVMGAKNVPVFAMPRMRDFLKNNAPWSQLVSLQNIDLKRLAADSTILIGEEIRVSPVVVPHRDEFSETVGFRIETPRKKVLFIPDIDKWTKWGHSILEEVKKADIALLDATFFKDGELPNRPMSEVPHPFVQETMQLFEGQPLSIRQKVMFIHFNHTNPLLYQEVARKEVLSKGFLLAEEGMRLGL